MEKDISTDITTNEGGKVIFANDVIATIANLATMEIEGVMGLTGGVMEELTGKLGKKNYTKGVKVEVNDDTVVADMTIVVKYGCKIQDVCRQIQQNVKKAIETMTGLDVAQVNVFVQSIAFDKAAKPVVEDIEKTTEE
ncbi:MAG: Asp23/Gls24 family envelope stress response protein [Clostridia bacterium]|nr:Asp23/Gls24 family envelope stress response protein [Clostridia bacterium]